MKPPKYVYSPVSGFGGQSSLKHPLVKGLKVLPLYLNHLRLSITHLSMLLLFFLSLSANTLYAQSAAPAEKDQCGTWVDKDFQEEAENAHVLYRDFLKANDYEQAYEYWKTAYELAPAADGKRASHYKDGRKILMEFYKKETDEARKKELAQQILQLYDEQMACYGDEVILLGRKAYDMFYYLRSPYSEVLAVLDAAVEKGGNDCEYIIFDPYARILTYEFENGRMDAERARQIIIKLNEIAEYNIANNQQFGSYFQQAKEAMDAVIAPVEPKIFDCEYYKKKFEPEFRANPEDYEMLERFYKRLVKQGCDESDPLVAEIKAQYDKVVAVVNAQRLAEFHAKNPGAHAKHIYEQGKELEKEGKKDEAMQKYREALAKYDEAIEKAKAEKKGDEVLATYYFAQASIHGRKFKRFSKARDLAYKAAKMKGNWGAPYMLIGDLYAMSANSCGNDAYERGLVILAAIDKYAYAKSIDPEVAEEAGKKIARYSEHKPDKNEGFMRGVQAGQKAKIKCWIGETVTVRFK